MTQPPKYLTFLVLCMLLCSATANGTWYTQNNPYPFETQNAQILAGSLIYNLAIHYGLKDKNMFCDADKGEVEGIRKLAIAMGFPKDFANKIVIKTPTLANPSCNNNFFAFFDTIISGRCSEPLLQEILKDENVKKFIYAHELSHIKFKHSLKKVLLLLALPLTIHFGFKYGNKGTQEAAKTLLSLESYKKVRPYLEKLSKTTNHHLFKLMTQMATLFFMYRKMEENADKNAALLGPDVAKGGIKFLETNTKIAEKNKEEALVKTGKLRPVIEPLMTLGQ